MELVHWLSIDTSYIPRGSRTCLEQPTVDTCTNAVVVHFAADSIGVRGSRTGREQPRGGGEAPRARGGARGAGPGALAAEGGAHGGEGDCVKQRIQIGISHTKPRNFPLCFEGDPVMGFPMSSSQGLARDYVRR